MPCAAKPAAPTTQKGNRGYWFTVLMSVMNGVAFETDQNTSMWLNTSLNAEGFAEAVFFLSGDCDRKEDADVRRLRHNWSTALVIETSFGKRLRGVIADAFAALQALHDNRSHKISIKVNGSATLVLASTPGQSWAFDERCSWQTVKS